MMKGEARSGEMGEVRKLDNGPQSTTDNGFLEIGTGFGLN
jgi:hypothetical protein